MLYGKRDRAHLFLISHQLLCFRGSLGGPFLLELGLPRHPRRRQSRRSVDVKHLGVILRNVPHRPAPWPILKTAKDNQKERKMTHVSTTF